MQYHEDHEGHEEDNRMEIETVGPAKWKLLLSRLSSHCRKRGRAFFQIDYSFVLFVSFVVSFQDLYFRGLNKH